MQQGIAGIKHRRDITMDEKQLIVEKAYPNDSGRGVARIDPKKFLELDIFPGDIIEIEGKKRTSAKTLRLDMMDWGHDIIRIDGFIRQNAGAGIGDHVKIRKAEFKYAEKVVLAPPEGTSIQFGEDAEMVKQQIMKRSITKGDIIFVMSTMAHPFLGRVVTGQTIPLVAMETEPEGIILIRDGTEIKLKDKPIITEANGTIFNNNDINEAESYIYFLLGFDKIEKEREYSIDELHEILGERRFMLLIKLYSTLDKVFYPDRKVHTQ